MEGEVAWDKIDVILYVFVLIITSSLYWSLLILFWSWWYTLECCIISLVAYSVFQDQSFRKYFETLLIKYSCSILFFFLFFFLNYLNHVWIFIWIIYFKIFRYLYYLFYFYFNYVKLLFTTWLKLLIYN